MCVYVVYSLLVSIRVTISIAEPLHPLSPIVYSRDQFRPTL